ncbi:MAG: hypothetical protein FWH07_05835, partial [Oscillospiraceae bacterium]|nr:hypothetical protein [Oscillospiraceae bacterium]
NRSFEIYSDIESIEIDSDESTTVGGWAFEQFDKIPAVGESVSTDDFKITVLSMKERRIGRLKFETLRTGELNKENE